MNHPPFDLFSIVDLEILDEFIIQQEPSHLFSSSAEEITDIVIKENLKALTIMRYIRTIVFPLYKDKVCLAKRVNHVYPTITLHSKNLLSGTLKE